MGEVSNTRGPEPARRNELLAWLMDSQRAVTTQAVLVPSVSALADECGIPLRSVEKALAELRRMGAVQVTRKRGQVRLEVL